jgi:hypothetical protein
LYDYNIKSKAEEDSIVSGLVDYVGLDSFDIELDEKHLGYTIDIKFKEFCYCFNHSSYYIQDSIKLTDPTFTEQKNEFMYDLRT